jgi:Ras-related protein Rab-32
MEAFCQRLGLQFGSVRFSFDGNRISADQTAEQVIYSCIYSSWKWMKVMLLMLWLNKPADCNSNKRFKHYLTAMPLRSMYPMLRSIPVVMQVHPCQFPFRKIEPIKTVSNNFAGFFMSQSQLFKIIVVGDYAVGKTTLIRKYTTGVFTDSYKITIGVDFCLKTLKWNDTQDISIQLWDIAGHERFGSMTRIYYQYAIAAVVCFDISRPSTLDNVKKWRDDINDKVTMPDGKPIPMILLANKCDIKDVTIDREKLNAFAKENGFVGWFETSSKDAINVERAFNTLIEQILNVTKNVGSVNPDAKKEGTVKILDQKNQIGATPVRGGCCG